MKVLIINGSPRINGNTSIAIDEFVKVMTEEGIECETIQVGNLSIRGCLACGTCHKSGKCIIDDEVNQTLVKLHECDGLVLATPVYYASANGTLMSFLDRLFYANNQDLSLKVGSSICVLRRGGGSSTFDELNKYFTISGMPIVSSYYWNSVHGLQKGEALEDKEGLWNMRCLAHNMAFLIKAINLGKEQLKMTVKEPRQVTNFIR